MVQIIHISLKKMLTLYMVQFHFNRLDVIQKYFVKTCQARIYLRWRHWNLACWQFMYLTFDITSTYIKRKIFSSLFFYHFLQNLQQEFRVMNIDCKTMSKNDPVKLVSLIWTYNGTWVFDAVLPIIVYFKKHIRPYVTGRKYQLLSLPGGKASVSKISGESPISAAIFDSTSASGL